MSFKIGNIVELTEDCGDVPKYSKGLILKISHELGVIKGLHVEFRIEGKR